MPYYRQASRSLPWPEAVQILARRKVLGFTYSRLMGEIRSQRRATAFSWINSTLFAGDVPRPDTHELRSALDNYMRTLADLRGAVEIVFPLAKVGRKTPPIPPRSR